MLNTLLFQRKISHKQKTAIVIKSCEKTTGKLLVNYGLIGSCDLSLKHKPFVAFLTFNQHYRILQSGLLPRTTYVTAGNSATQKNDLAPSARTLLQCLITDYFRRKSDA